MRALMTIPLVALCLVAPSSAQTIYPIDRADILAGSLFDFKVEFPELQTSNSAAVTINGKPYANTFGRDATFIEREDGKDQSALVLRDVSLRPGTNSASAYASGHKSAVNAMGVYADRTANPFDDPKVEPIAKLVKRRLNMAVGIVTNTEIEDATPAAMATHTRRRASYDQIVEQYFDVKPDVLMGGGLANFLPANAAGSKRKDDIDYINKFRDAGYRYVTSGTELKAADADEATNKLLGLFNLGNMDGVLDRKFLKGGSVKSFLINRTSQSKCRPRLRFY
jgi:alkaline phosphatase